MEHVRGTLRKIFAGTLKEESGEDGVLLAWPVVCGSPIAQNSRAVGYVDGRLTIEVPDAVWRRQLQGLKERYVAKMNEISPRPVNEIRFVAAHADVRDAGEKE